ncbi:MAG: hypothetical protein ACREEM_34770 [Blastocatellia bacterium]
MPNIPAQCQPIADALQALQEERTDLQAQLHTGLSGPQKTAVVKQITALNSKIAVKEQELNQCLGCLNPIKSTLSSSAATIRTSDPRFPATTLAPALTLDFSGCNREVVRSTPLSFTLPSISIGSFLGAPITDSVTITISPGIGTYDRALGDLTIPFTLTITHVVTILTFFGPSLSFTPPNSGSSIPSAVLTTGTVPSTLSPVGSISGASLNKTTTAITLVAAGVLTGGLLNGTAIDVLMPATLVPVP